MGKSCDFRQIRRACESHRPWSCSQDGPATLTALLGGQVSEAALGSCPRPEVSSGEQPAAQMHSTLAFLSPPTLVMFHIILLFHTVHGVLKPRILKWFAILFSSGPHSVRSLHHDLPILGCLMGMA